MTNHEKIKNYSVDEMAIEICKMKCKECFYNGSGCPSIDKNNKCVDKFKAWLLQETRKEKLCF